MTGQYILDADGSPQPAPNLLAWGIWMQTGNRRVAEDDCDGWRVSTVFLGLDNSFSPGAAPVLFETMVFGEDCEGGDCLRYTTRNLALAGHCAIVQALQANQNQAGAEVKQLLIKIADAHKLI